MPLGSSLANKVKKPAACKRVFFKSLTMPDVDPDSDDNNKLVELDIKVPSQGRFSKDSSSDEESKQEDGPGMPTISIEPCSEL